MKKQSPNKLTDKLSELIRDEFVHGYIDESDIMQYPSIDTLVKRHNVARATLYRRADKENWQKQKNHFQTTLANQRDNERIENMSKAGERLDDTAIQIAQVMMGQVGSKLKKGIIAERDGDVPNIIPPPMLRELSNVAINAQKIGKLALGEAHEISKVSADVSSPEAFREVMEQLDEIAEERSSRHSHALQ